MKYRRSVGQVEIIVDFESEKIIGAKHFTAVSRNSKVTVVRANGEVQSWFVSGPGHSHPRQFLKEAIQIRSFWLFQIEFQDEVI